MATSSVNLSWRVVCGRFEVDELMQYGVFEEYVPQDPRHTLFLTIKHPNQLFLKGAWGAEIVYYDKQDNMTTGQLGKVWATESRGEQIATWIRDQMFNPNNFPKNTPNHK